MALKIVKASEPVTVDTIVLVIYGGPGMLKTSTAQTADRPLLLDTDKGIHRAVIRRDITPVESWPDIANIAREDVEGFRTLILDTSGRALDHLALHIMSANPKMGSGGALTLKGYGQLKSDFAAWLTKIRSFGLDIVLIAHSDEKQQGDDIIERLDITGSSKNEIYKVADAMGRMAIENGRLMLNFSPTATKFGKDPAQFGAVPVPVPEYSSTFLADLIQRLKDSMNKQSAEVQEAMARAEDWTAALAHCKTADHFTSMIERAESAREKRQLLEVAEKAGCTYDKDAKGFVGGPEPKATADAAQDAEQPEAEDEDPFAGMRGDKEGAAA